MPDVFLGDLHAQVAACRVAANRLGETADKHGDNALLSAFQVLIDRAEQMTRQELKKAAGRHLPRRRLPGQRWH